MVPPLLAFCGVALVVICTPGPDTMLTIRNAVAGGRRGGVLTAAGVAAGQLVWTLASAMGLTALLQTSQTVFLWLKLLGAGYLVYLGVLALASAYGSPARIGGDAAPTPLGGRAAFRQGFVSNLANPKMAAFFVSLLPQFVPAGWNLFAGFVMLGAAFCTLTLVWLSLYAVALHRARSALARHGVRRALDAVAGTVLVALGARLATTSTRVQP
jgi:threonine/homoserine/homoserine lactone efflux protein